MVEHKRNYPLVRKIFLVLFIISTLIMFGLLIARTNFTGGIPMLATTNTPAPTAHNINTPTPPSSIYATSIPPSTEPSPMVPVEASGRPIDPTMVMMYISLITSTTSLIGFATTTYITLHRDNERHRNAPRRKKARNKSRIFGQGDKAKGCVLISYRRSDSADVAGRIYDRLVEEFGQELIFKDVDSIPLGVDFKEYLDEKVGESSVFLEIIGKTWLDTVDEEGKRRLDDPNDFVRIEIESAFNRKIPVIPLLVSNARMPEEEELPPSLRKLIYMNGILIRPDPDFHNDMDRLISALDEYVG